MPTEGGGPLENLNSRSARIKWKDKGIHVRGTWELSCFNFLVRKLESVEILPMP